MTMRPIKTPSADRTMAKLKSLARQAGVDTGKVLQRYGIERLLARLFAGSIAPRLMLKGGMLVMQAEGVGPLAGRSTADLDIHVPGFEGDIDRFRDAVHAACSGAAFDDGCEFTGAEVKVRRPESDRVQGGTVQVWAHVAGSLCKVSIDVTFDSRDLGAGIDGEYGSMLGGSFPIRRVPWASQAADKVQAMVRHGANTHRMRDYYDLHVLFTKGLVAPEDMAAPLRAAFEAFGGEVPESLDDIEALGPDAVAHLASAWDTEKRTRRFAVPTPSFAEVVGGIRVMVGEALEAGARPSPGR